MNWPKGDDKCKHLWEDGKNAIEYNDETMGGINSWWRYRCNRCGYVEKDD